MGLFKKKVVRESRQVPGAILLISMAWTWILSTENLSGGAQGIP